MARSIKRTPEQKAIEQQKALQYMLDNPRQPIYRRDYKYSPHVIRFLDKMAEQELIVRGHADDVAHPNCVIYYVDNSE